MSRKDRLNLYFVKNISNMRADAAVWRKKLEAREPSPDTKLRKEIQATIKKMADKGEKAETIISVLESNQEYCKYANFFSSWIANYLKKEQARTEKLDRER